MFILFGLMAVANIVGSLAYGHVEFDFDILGLWIGSGLLRLRRGWRKVALVFVWLGLIAAPLLLVALILGGRQTHDVKVFGEVAGSVEAWVPISLFIAFPNGDTAPHGA